MKRPSIISLALVVGTAVFASSAAADAPTHTSFSYTYSAVQTGICPFDVDVTTAASGTRIDFVDVSGAVTRTYIHQLNEDTFRANGRTLTSFPFTFDLQISYDSSGNPNLIASGIIERIPLPDGSIFISAGRVDFTAHTGVGHLLSPDHGNPGDVASFCAALSP